MDFQLATLPYRRDALSPHLSAETIDFHYDRHHRGYLEKLKGLVQGTPDEHLELEQLVTRAEGVVFNNAAQVWNHDFYWNSMSPDGGGLPTGRIGEAIAQSFGSLAAFEEQFASCAVGLFGSGYVWLTYDPAQSRVRLEALKDADSPLLSDRIPLLAADVWEHAYYIDYRNDRHRYAETFVTHLANWTFAETNFRRASMAGSEAA